MLITWSTPVHTDTNIVYFNFADDIDLIRGTVKVLQALTTKLETTAHAHGREIISENSVTLTNCGNATNIRIMMNGEHLEEVK